MTLVLTEDQLMFRDATKRFAAERAPVAHLRKLRDDTDPVGFSRELWKEMADMGWAGVLVPEEHGGVGFGFVGAGLIAMPTMTTSLAATASCTSLTIATRLFATFSRIVGWRRSSPRIGRGTAIPANRGRAAR